MTDAIRKAVNGHAGKAVVGLSVSSLIALLSLAYHAGQMSMRVDHLEAAIHEIKADVRALVARED